MAAAVKTAVLAAAALSALATSPAGTPPRSGCGADSTAFNNLFENLFEIAGLSTEAERAPNRQHTNAAEGAFCRSRQRDSFAFAFFFRPHIRSLTIVSFPARRCRATGGARGGGRQSSRGVPPP
eukprot:1436693-Pyramimonas_sp.AAC.1